MAKIVKLVDGELVEVSTDRERELIQLIIREIIEYMIKNLEIEIDIKTGKVKVKVT